MTDQLHKDTRHIFNVVFNTTRVKIENRYSFEVYPIYWATEIISGTAPLVGSATVTVPSAVLISGSGVSRCYTDSSMDLSVLFSASMTMLAYGSLSGSGISNPYDISALIL